MRSTAQMHASPAGRDSHGIPQHVGEVQLPLLSRIRLWFDSYFHPALAAGTRAELHFVALAEQKRWVLERVDQSRGGLAKYRAVADRSVKRGDYICRNCNNAEIELKCKSRYRDDNCFYIEYREIKRLQEMQRITGSRVVFALMEREGSGVRHGSLRMFLLDFLMSTPDHRAGRLYDNKTKCLR